MISMGSRPCSGRTWQLGFSCGGRRGFAVVDGVSRGGGHRERRIFIDQSA